MFRGRDLREFACLQQSWDFALQVNAEAERRNLVGQIDSRTIELKSMQEAFLKQLQTTQREIGLLKQAVLSPTSQGAGRRERLTAEVSAIRAEIESKAVSAAARVNETMTAAENTTRRIVEAARGDSERLSSAYLVQLRIRHLHASSWLSIAHFQMPWPSSRQALKRQSPRIGCSTKTASIRFLVRFELP